jgi:glycosyltransferase involved in cell wall biosynthesis
LKDKNSKNLNGRSSLLVTATTFPRWQNDSIPDFVLQFCRYQRAYHGKIRVVVPHYKGAKRSEVLGGVDVKRYRYWPLSSGQTLVYEGGAVNRVSKSPLYALKLLCLMVSLFFNTFYYALKDRSIINAHWLIPQGFVAVIVGQITRKKVVITVHGGDVFSLNQGLFKAIKKFTLKKADAVIVNSSATREACEEIFPDREYSVIPMGVDISRFSNIAKHGALPEKEARDKRFKILFVGRLTQEKGVIYLLEALVILRAQKKDFLAILAGDGPEKEALENFVNDNDLAAQVVMPGWVDSSTVASYYSAADVFVGPSIIAETGWKEAFGLVFAESLATGTAVIGTDTGGIKDIVIDGENGFLVHEKAPAEIAERLTELMENPQLLKRMQGNARQRIEDNFSWEVIASKYDQVFNKQI